MSFSSLVQDLSFRDAASERRPPIRGPGSVSTYDDRASYVSRADSHVSRARSYASTAATSVSISGDIGSQLHGGYCHPLARSWQAERQLTKVRFASPRTPLSASDNSRSQCLSTPYSFPTLKTKKPLFPLFPINTAEESTKLSHF